MESKMQNRNKTECGVCNKWMRSDHLKRHHQSHIEELTHLQEFNKKQEEKIRKIQEIARENNLAIPKEITSKEREYVDQINDIRTEYLQNRQLYLKKIEIDSKRRKSEIDSEIDSKKRKSTTKIDDNVRARCLENHQRYLKKIELGKEVASYVESGVVMKEALDGELKNYFDTYMYHKSGRKWGIYPQ